MFLLYLNVAKIPFWLIVSNSLKSSLCICHPFANTPRISTNCVSPIWKRQYAEDGTGLSTSEGTENQYICLWCVGWTLNFVDTFIDRLRIQPACTGATSAATSWFWWGCILVSQYIKPLCHEACNTQRLNHGTRSLWLLQVEANLPEAVRRKEEVRIWCVQMPVEFCNFLPPTYSDLQVLLSYSCLISPVSSVFSNQIRL